MENPIRVRSRSGLFVGLVFMLLGFALLLTTAANSSACLSAPSGSGTCSINLTNSATAITVSYIVILAGAAISLASLVTTTRGVGFLMIFLGVMTGVNDMVSGGGLSLDGFFHVGDLVDFINNGVVHHEPFTVALIVVGAIFVLASYVIPRPLRAVQEASA